MLRDYGENGKWKIAKEKFKGKFKSINTENTLRPGSGQAEAAHW
jgi:hypothetical protein